MACEGFEKSLIEEALASTDPALMAHLAKCADCCAELAAQRELQERITAGIAALVADDPSPALLMRVRARIEEESAPRSTNWMQWAAAGVAVAALAVLALWFAGRPSGRLQTPDTNSAQSLKTSSSVAQTSPQLVASQQSAPSVMASGHAQLPLRHIPHAKPAALPLTVAKTDQPIVVLEPTIVLAANAPHGEIRGEIIVPAGQREAVLRLVDALRTGRVDAASLLRAAQPGDLAPLAILPIEVRPMNGSDKDDGTEHQLENEF